MTNNDQIRLALWRFKMLRQAADARCAARAPSGAWAAANLGDVRFVLQETDWPPPIAAEELRCP